MAGRDGRRDGPGIDGGWSLQASAVPGGVRLDLGLPDIGGGRVTAAIVLDRAEARAFARALLAAAGDGAERTFPKPGPRTATPTPNPENGGPKISG